MAPKSLIQTPTIIPQCDKVKDSRVWRYFEVPSQMEIIRTSLLGETIQYISMKDSKQDWKETR